MATLDPDPEIQAIQAIVDRFGPLTVAARQRVLAWAQGRFGAAAPDMPQALIVEPPAPALPRQVQPISSFPPGFGDR